MPTPHPRPQVPASKPLSRTIVRLGMTNNLAMLTKENVGQTLVGYWGAGGFAFGGGKNMDMQTKVKVTVLESINQILWLPIQILVFSFSGIIIALLYLKTRLAGGESMNDLLEKFEDDEGPRKKWQERVRQRLIQSGRIPSKP